MKGILENILRVARTLVPHLNTIANSLSPSLPSDYPASIRFSAWLAAFNTGDKAVLAAYHTDSIFPYSVASRNIKGPEREYGLAPLLALSQQTTRHYPATH